MKTFGEKLKEARTIKNMKQADVAKELDCAPTSLTNWENGKINPSLDVLSRLCRIYEISPLTLLDREYSYSDIADITKKSVSERSYEEQVALNFSYDILAKLLLVDAQKEETARIEATASFLHDTGIMDKFGMLNKAEVDRIKAEYDKNKGAESDILFAYHILTRENKKAFISMLSGLIASKENVQQINDKMDDAVSNTLLALQNDKDTVE